MIDWKEFYANGGYYGLNDPYCYDDGLDEDEEVEDILDIEPYLEREYYESNKNDKDNE